MAEALGLSVVGRGWWRTTQALIFLRTKRKGRVSVVRLLVAMVGWERFLPYVVGSAWSKS